MTNQKPTIDTQKIKKKEPKHHTKENHHSTREEIKRRKEQRELQKQPKKQLTKWQLSTYLSIIPLNVNGLNAPIKIHRVAEWMSR